MKDKMMQLELACTKYFSITSRRYRQLADEGRVPQPEKGLISFPDAAKGIIDHYRELSEGGSDLAEARRQKVLVETELKRLQLLLEKKELISRSEILGLFMTRLNQVKMGLTVLNRTLPPVLYGRNVREAMSVIKAACMELLNLYSRPDALFPHRLTLQIPDARAPGPADAPFLQKEPNYEKFQVEKENPSEIGARLFPKVETGESTTETSAASDDSEILKELSQRPIVQPKPEFDLSHEELMRSYGFNNLICSRVIIASGRAGVPWKEINREAYTNKESFEAWWSALFPGKTDAEKLNHFTRYE